MADPLTDALNRRAAFAQNFPNAGNLDQRRRFAQDISDASERQKEREAEEFEALQQRDPQLMNAVTGRMREGRMAREGQQKAGLERLRFDRLKDRDVKLDDLNERKFLLQKKNGLVQRKKAMMDIDRAERELDDTFAYEVGEMQLRDEFGPGSDGYKTGLAELAASLPYLNKEIRQQSLKEVGFEDPDVALSEAKKFLESGGKRVTGVPVGRGMKGTMEAPESQDIDRELGIWQEKKAKALNLGDPDYLKFTEDRVKELQAKKSGTQTTTKTAAPESTDFTDANSFKEAFQKAAPGTILMYNGKRWQKPAQ